MASRNPAAARAYPAGETQRAREAVADYLTRSGVPNIASVEVRLAVRDAWLEVLCVIPSTAHPECGRFTIVHTDRARGSQVYAFHAPTGLVFPAETGTVPEDTGWLRDIAAGLEG